MTGVESKIQLVMDLRRRGISSARVLGAIEQVPREVFVTKNHENDAYTDIALPIDCGQTISQPFVVAYMTEQLDVDTRDRVLEVGTGSGYQVAILSHLCRRVYSIERYRTLLKTAEKRFEKLGLTNITTLLRDGYEGWPEQAPFDRIIVTAVVGEVPLALMDQLKEGGKMVLPVDESADNQYLVRIEREGDVWHRTNLIPVRFVPLVRGIAREL